MNLTWARRRQWMIIGGAILIGLGVLVIVLFSVFYKFPSCTDRKQNQNEEGIDCGGSCTYLCTASLVPPHVSFVRAVVPTSARADAIAYIENKNQTAAARSARYTIEFYGPDNAVVGKRDGVADIPPGAVVPIFLPGVYSGNTPVIRAFLEFDDASLKWTSDTETPVAPKVSNVALTGTDTPRVTATLTNPSAHTMRNVKVIATLFAADDTAIAASQTVVPTIPAQGASQAIFTWPSAFTATPVRIEVLPVVTLSAL